MNIPSQHNFPRCEVRGLLYGVQCWGYKAPDSDLCTYHTKLAAGMTKPPSDDCFIDDAADQGTAILAVKSYLDSSHPEFANLIDTGGLTIDAA